MSYSSPPPLPAAWPAPQPPAEPEAARAAPELPGARARIPGAVYRLQLNGGFTFDHALEVLPYLERLGITDLYLSPVLQARPGSQHGYDVIDCNRVSEELGGEDALRQLSASLAQRGMGLLLDIVPNHLCVADDGNGWWNDVLENGAASVYAGIFDIDWQRSPDDGPAVSGTAPLVLPVLLEPLEQAVAARRLSVIVHSGALALEYRGRRLPTDPRSWLPLLQEVWRELRTQTGATTEQAAPPGAAPGPAEQPLAELLRELEQLPATHAVGAEQVRERHLGVRRCKMLLGAWLAGPMEEASQCCLWSRLERLNARPGPGGADPAREDWTRLLGAQAYRLLHWPAGLDRINYRRYADIADLAAVRQEHPDVFSATHGLVLRLVAQGLVTGLRIDHPDGLLDPVGYLGRLQHGALLARGGMPREEDAGAAPLYVVVEKILSGAEPLRGDWPVHGTTGYEMLALLNGLFRHPGSQVALRAFYERITGQSGDFVEALHGSKRTVLETLFVSEHRALTSLLAALLAKHGEPVPALPELHQALGEVVLQVPVYSHYLRRMRPERMDDAALVRHAASAAAQARPELPPGWFHRIAEWALEPEPLATAGPPETPVHQGQEFALRFRQLVAAVMGKGLEDTAFYRHGLLLSLNELGCDADHFSVPVEDFHRRLAARQREWPGGLSTLSTHDTKRSSDVRARLNVLSELPWQWEQAVSRWQSLNGPARPRYMGRPVPDPAEEYALYQTLLGSWPLPGPRGAALQEYEQRIQACTRKALREAKVHSSWIDPDPRYEAAQAVFVRALLTDARGAAFRADLEAFLPTVALAGAYQALAQWLLLMAAPGVPDLYQGNELWDLSLVDPDNRRPVDFALRARLLEELDAQARKDPAGLVAELVAELRTDWADGRLKLYVLSRALRFRRSRQELFLRGGYEALECTGARREHAVGFVRTLGAGAALVLAGRFFAGLGVPQRHPIGEQAWGGSQVRLAAEWSGRQVRDVLTGEVYAPRAAADGAVLDLAQVFQHLPLALLERPA